MECLLTPVRAQPSTDCQHPLKSKSLPQEHLLGDIISQGPETPEGTGDASAKSPHVRSCFLSGLQIQPVLEEMSTPSWWISDLPSAETPLSYPLEPSFHSPSLSLPHKATVLLSACC